MLLLLRITAIRALKDVCCVNRQPYARAARLVMATTLVLVSCVLSLNTLQETLLPVPAAQVEPSPVILGRIPVTLAPPDAQFVRFLSASLVNQGTVCRQVCAKCVLN